MCEDEIKEINLGNCRKQDQRREADEKNISELIRLHKMNVGERKEKGLRMPLRSLEESLKFLWTLEKRVQWPDLILREWSRLKIKMCCQQKVVVSDCEDLFRDWF